MAIPAETDERRADVGASAPSVLEPALWQRLAEAGSSDELASAWLTLQGRMIPGAARGFVRLPADGGLKMLAGWPDGATETGDLREGAEAALAEKRPIARGVAPGAPGPATVAYPILIDGNVAAVVALELKLTNPAQAREELRDAVRQLQWGTAWLRDHLRGRRAVGDTAQLGRARATLDLIASALDQQGFAAAAMAAATEMAIRFDCARVSIGFTKRGSARLVAISHTAQFGRQMTLVRAIGAAMDEAIDQRSSILFPVAADDAVASQAHAHLARMQHDGQVLTVPLFVVDAFVGAITFERSSGHLFDADTVQLLDVAATALGPILYEKKLNDRWLVTKALEGFGVQLKRLLGPGYAARKLIAAGLVIAAVFFTFATDTYRVSADAQIEGSVRRAVVSAYDGYIQEARVRAGELVKAGDTLATLEDRELALERLKWATERQQYSFEYDKALASRQPATINVIKAQIEQADAQLALIDEQIARTRLVAPFDGMVVSGDLSQRIGGAVNRGELLFEIAPLTDYRVVMQVDERRIADIREGQTGEVVFTSLPGESFPVTVGKVTPVAQSHDGKNLFQVEGALLRTSDRLRPGMIGVAKIAIGNERLIATWLRPAIDWFRLASWRWTP